MRENCTFESYQLEHCLLNVSDEVSWYETMCYNSSEGFSYRDLALMFKVWHTVLCGKECATGLVAAKWKFKKIYLKIN